MKSGRKFSPHLFKALLKSQSGATAIEYGLIAALIALVVVGALTSVSNVIWNLMTNVSASLH